MRSAGVRRGADCRGKSLQVGGFTSRELIRLLRSMKGLRVVSGDVVEVAPAYDHAGKWRLPGGALGPTAAGSSGTRCRRHVRPFFRVLGRTLKVLPTVLLLLFHILSWIKHAGIQSSILFRLKAPSRVQGFRSSQRSESSAGLLRIRQAVLSPSLQFVII